MALWNWEKLSEPFSVKDKPSKKSSSSQKARAGQDIVPKRHQKLGPWLATGICGNDITSSCLYVAAIATAYAGIYSPLVLLLVGGLLYLYRQIYSEVVDALPLNGGAYNALLNTTTKLKASVAACMTFLSYLATACISAKTAVEYANTLFPAPMPVVEVTIALLFFFAMLSIWGIGESAIVALIIFIFHLLTLGVFIVIGISFLISDPSMLLQNWHTPSEHGLIVALFFGFSAALLGISGFESSANYIEEQQEGVFPKTLRNMWYAVTILNPLIALIALSVLPITAIEGQKNSLLANVSDVMGGSWLKILISIDASLVLSGAVLTSFVGSSGLVGRMTLDRCLPQVLLKTNKRGTHHFIVLTFLILCSSIMLLTGGDLLALGGVYTISFLGVMALFAVGNILLKIRRSRLPRKYKASWGTIFIALLGTVSGILGNILVKSEYVRYWALYFIPAMSLIAIMLYRQQILKLSIILAGDILKNFSFSKKITEKLDCWLHNLEGHGIIFFTKGDDAANLNRAMLYVKDNEITDHVSVIHIYQERQDIPKHLESDLRTIDKLYPEIQIELVLRQGKFTPEYITELSKEFGVPKNYMFLGAPSAKFPYPISDLGGVRLII